jgi:hypothetical protein
MNFARVGGGRHCDECRNKPRKHGRRDHCRVNTLSRW